MFQDPHSFHIPVMGLAFTIDSPLKIARFGISSVVSLSDDTLMEQMRRHYCGEYGLAYDPIHPSAEDYRAKRTTAYLDLLHTITRQQFCKLKEEAFAAGTEITRYFELLPDTAPLTRLYRQMQQESDGERKEQLQQQLRLQMQPGAIDVNIMTKLDRANFSKEGNALPPEYSDALAALRGYANSQLNSSIIFSAGLNPRLYTYLENFPDFYPDAFGAIRKKVVLKVSDFRSAAIQGKFLAKKGIWVSEFRIESGLNCGGHAFATDGLLLGPILEEFKQKRAALAAELQSILDKALEEKGLQPSAQPLEQALTYQGGIGTAGEQAFLLEYYQVDKTGWGTPFLLVPEATTVDEPTMERLARAEKKDLHLSYVSPLGVPFNTLKDSSAEQEKQARIRQGKPGSPCIKKHLVFNTEFSEEPICTASHEYQKLKLQELDKLEMEPAAHREAAEKITAKECLCVGLANSALIINKIVKKSKAVSICPGPNMAYFSRIFSLEEIVGHIYGRRNILSNVYRPSLFINELVLYIEYLEKQMTDSLKEASARQLKSLQTFKDNLLAGIEYYKTIVPSFSKEEENSRRMLQELSVLRERIYSLQLGLICV
ncbi:hypothetical protein [Cesiribacter sp. SM1]|uniref:hypothetical protein n=1 Tax=Cesiribacter sp. SM1 TaxID=2861196 RepID=UPI001CD74314|nr:hypothetical protein [Cesiribacter sp. SM1]